MDKRTYCAALEEAAAYHEARLAGDATDHEAQVILDALDELRDAINNGGRQPWRRRDPLLEARRDD